MQLSKLKQSYQKKLKLAKQTHGKTKSRASGSYAHFDESEDDAEEAGAMGSTDDYSYSS